jgi:hypothetical protein
MYDLKKKIIFLHPPKCGGTSIEQLLGFLEERQKNPNINFFKHASLREHIQEVSKISDPNKFFKFSIIRNPWDRAVSYYNHKKFKAYISFLHKGYAFYEMPENVKDAKKLTFKEYIFKYFPNEFNSEKQTKPFMLFEENFYLQYVIRFEFLKKDIYSIRQKIGIGNDYIIPHLNDSSIYLEKKDYKEYYDEESKNLIENLFKWDILKFNYKF